LSLLPPDSAAEQEASGHHVTTLAACLRPESRDPSIPDPLFVERAKKTAESAGVGWRSLRTLTLLHLPRFADADGVLAWEGIDEELARRADELRADQARVRGLVPTDRFEQPRDLVFKEKYEASEANEVFANLHYLKNARPDSKNFALIDPVHGRPVSLCSISPLQWKPVARHLYRRFGIPPENVWEISRMYSFDVAPGNVTSFLLARVRKAMRREEPTAELLTTAMDPNVGFNGNSYRGANWKEWMKIQARPYFYLDGDYVSPRQLRERFGTAGLERISAEYGIEVTTSVAKLHPSSIFACRINGATESVPGELTPLRR
jgi:hypothetical protein